jgi:hypothetical protein
MVVTRLLVSIHIDEGGSFDAVLTLPLDRKGGLGILDVDGLSVPVARQPCGEVFGSVEQPRIAGFGAEQHNLTEADDPLIVFGCPLLNVTDLIGKPKTLPLDHTFA